MHTFHAVCLFYASNILNALMCIALALGSFQRLKIGTEIMTKFHSSFNIKCEFGNDSDYRLSDQNECV